MKITIKHIKISALWVVVFWGLKTLYSYSPYKLIYIGSYDKIWSHRVNSLEKLDSALNFFDGVELDLVYNAIADVLDVNHPPTNSINLSFENYVSNITNTKKPYLWLDIKNLNNENAELIKLKLETILTKYNYPQNKIVIETRYPIALKHFKDSQYGLVYYLPYHMYLKENDILKKDLKTIDSVLKEQSNIAISSFFLDYKILKDNYPRKTKYLWFAGELESINNYTLTKKILKDSTVKAVLIPFKSLKGNR